MKPLLYLLATCAALLYIDAAYNRSLEQVYEYNKWVIENYCHPNVLKGLDK